MGFTHFARSRCALITQRPGQPILVYPDVRPLVAHCALAGRFGPADLMIAPGLCALERQRTVGEFLLLSRWSQPFSDLLPNSSKVCGTLPSSP